MASVWCAHCVRMACKSPFSQYYMPHRVPYLYALYTYVFYACHLCMSYMYTVISSSPYYSSALPSCSLALPSSRSPTRPHFRSKSFPSPSTAQTHAHTHARAHTHLILNFSFNNQAAGRICSCAHTPTISQHAAKCECACMSVCDVCMHVRVHKHTRTRTPHTQASTRARTPTHPPTPHRKHASTWTFPGSTRSVCPPSHTTPSNLPHRRRATTGGIGALWRGAFNIWCKSLLPSLLLLLSCSFLLLGHLLRLLRLVCLNVCLCWAAV